MEHLADTFTTSPQSHRIRLLPFIESEPTFLLLIILAIRSLNTSIKTFNVPPFIRRAELNSEPV